MKIICLLTTVLFTNLALAQHSTIKRCDYSIQDHRLLALNGPPHSKITSMIDSSVIITVEWVHPGKSPYKLNWIKDGVVIAGAVGTNLLGYQLISNKRDLTVEQLATKTRDKLPFFDRGNAGSYSSGANKDSYILFDASYGLPALVMLIDKSERSKFTQLFSLYVETITITGAMYTVTAGLVYRSRPFVYGNKAPLDLRLSSGSQRSFYGGHVATTAASTFFIAKVFSDFHPNSRLQPYLWGGASGLTALMGYWRFRSGYHFLSDELVSFAFGATTGILIPQWHKRNILKNISVSPSFNTQKGVDIVYHL